MKTERENFAAFGTTHFTIQIDKPIGEVGEDDPDLKKAIDTKARFLYKWHKERSEFDELVVKIHYSDTDDLGGTRYKRGGQKLKQYLEDYDW